MHESGLPYYDHRQTGWPTVAFLTILLVVDLVFIKLAARPNVTDSVRFALWGVFVIAVLSMGLFSSMRVIVDRERLTIRSGMGIAWRSVRLDLITDVQAVTTSWWWGRGVHLTPMGWLFNVSGSDAVQLTLARGMSVLIGTDEPDELLAALDGRLTTG